MSPCCPVVKAVLGIPGKRCVPKSVHRRFDSSAVSVSRMAAGWVDLGTRLKYRDAFRNSGFLKDGKLKIKLKADPQTGNPLNYSLMDNGTQGQVSARVRFGTGQDYCLVCPTGNKKDDATIYLAKDCPAGGCTAEPSTCNPPIPANVCSTALFCAA